MTTAVSFFEQQLPAHITNAKSKTMQAMGGGIAGGGFGNRISLRNSKFRFIQNGEDIGAHDQATLEVVVFAMAEHVQRMYYEGAYDPNTKTPPTCFSMDGKAPSDESAKKQSATCAVCPQNVKGSGRMPNTKACAYKKRVIVLAPADLEGPAFALDVTGMSMFGEQQPAQNLFSFKGYYEKLLAHNLDIAGIVTRLSFDDAASVPKLHFSPVRPLTEDEFAIVQQRMDDEDVGIMLKDMTNIMELDEVEPTKPAKQIVKPTAPAVVVEEPVAKAVPAKGFGAKTAAAAKGTPPTVTKAPLNIDLKQLVNFDD